MNWLKQMNKIKQGKTVQTRNENDHRFYHLHHDQPDLDQQNGQWKILHKHQSN